MKRAHRNRDLIAQLDPERDYERIYQRTVLYDFPTDARVGLNLAFYRIFAIPHMAQLLVDTGEMLGRPTKRAYDTGLIMYEIITNGLDHPRGREMVALINRAHRPWPISSDDYRYVLAAFIVVPLRWIDRRGWRPLLPHEYDASCLFYRHLADLMNIPNPPETYHDAEQLLDNYEREHLAPSDAGRRLMDATQDIVVRKLPRPTKRFGPALTAALLDQPRLGAAIGLPPPNPALRVAVDAAFTTRNLMQRFRLRRHRAVVPARTAGQRRLPRRVPARPTRPGQLEDRVTAHHAPTTASASATCTRTSASRWCSRARTGSGTAESTVIAARSRVSTSMTIDQLGGKLILHVRQRVSPL